MSAPSEVKVARSRWLIVGILLWETASEAMRNTIKTTFKRRNNKSWNAPEGRAQITAKDPNNSAAPFVPQDKHFQEAFNRQLNKWDCSLLCSIMERSHYYGYPKKSAESKAVVKLRTTRNTKLGHSTSLQFEDEAVYNALLAQVTGLLLRIGVEQDTIDEVVAENLYTPDPDNPDPDNPDDADDGSTAEMEERIAGLQSLIDNDIRYSLLEQVAYIESQYFQLDGTSGLDIETNRRHPNMGKDVRSNSVTPSKSTSYMRSSALTHNWLSDVKWETGYTDLREEYLQKKQKERRYGFCEIEIFPEGVPLPCISTNTEVVFGRYNTMYETNEGDDDDDNDNEGELICNSDRRSDRWCIGLSDDPGLCGEYCRIAYDDVTPCWYLEVFTTDTLSKDAFPDNKNKNPMFIRRRGAEFHEEIELDPSEEVRSCTLQTGDTIYLGEKENRSQKAARSRHGRPATVEKERKHRHCIKIKRAIIDSEDERVIKLGKSEIGRWKYRFSGEKHKCDVNDVAYRPEKRGGFAYIYKVEKGGKAYGIKCPKNQDNLSLMKKELLKLSKFSHPNIIYPDKPLFDVAPLLLMDWAQYGDLKEFIVKSGTLQSIDFKDNDYLLCLVDIFLQIARGIEHVHGVDEIHRDLKPQNVLIMSQRDHANAHTTKTWFSVKISDFNADLNVSTPRYRSAEQISNRYTTDKSKRVKLTAPTDVWNLGILGLEILTMGGWKPPPYRREQVLLAEGEVYDLEKEEKKIMTGGYTEEQKQAGLSYDHLPESSREVAHTIVTQLIEKCFVVEPTERITCQDLVALVSRKILEKLQAIMHTINEKEMRQTKDKMEYIKKQMVVHFEEKHAGKEKLVLDALRQRSFLKWKVTNKEFELQKQERSLRDAAYHLVRYWPWRHDQLRYIIDILIERHRRALSRMVNSNDPGESKYMSDRRLKSIKEIEDWNYKYNHAEHKYFPNFALDHIQQYINIMQDGAPSSHVEPQKYSLFRTYKYLDSLSFDFNQPFYAGFDDVSANEEENSDGGSKDLERKKEKWPYVLLGPFYNVGWAGKGVYGRRKKFRSIGETIEAAQRDSRCGKGGEALGISYSTGIGNYYVLQKCTRLRKYFKHRVSWLWCPVDEDLYDKYDEYVKNPENKSREELDADYNELIRKMMYGFGGDRDNSAQKKYGLFGQLGNRNLCDRSKQSALIVKMKESKEALFKYVYNLLKRDPKVQPLDRWQRERMLFELPRHLAPPDILMAMIEADAYSDDEKDEEAKDFIGSQVKTSRKDDAVETLMKPTEEMDLKEAAPETATTGVDGEKESAEDGQKESAGIEKEGEKDGGGGKESATEVEDVESGLIRYRRVDSLISFLNSMMYRSKELWFSKDKAIMFEQDLENPPSYFDCFKKLLERCKGLLMSDTRLYHFHKCHECNPLRNISANTPVEVIKLLVASHEERMWNPNPAEPIPRGIPVQTKTEVMTHAINSAFHNLCSEENAMALLSVEGAESASCLGASEYNDTPLHVFLFNGLPHRDVLMKLFDNYKKVHPHTLESEMNQESSPDNKNGYCHKMIGHDTGQEAFTLPIHYSVTSELPVEDIFKYLYFPGCLTSRNSGQATPLHSCCEGRFRTDVLKAMFEKGDGIEALMMKDMDDNLPLHVAHYNHAPRGFIMDLEEAYRKHYDNLEVVQETENAKGMTPEMCHNGVNEEIMEAFDMKEVVMQEDETPNQNTSHKHRNYKYGKSSLGTVVEEEGSEHDHGYRKKNNVSFSKSPQNEQFYGKRGGPPNKGGSKHGDMFSAYRANNPTGSARGKRFDQGQSNTFTTSGESDNSSNSNTSGHPSNSGNAKPGGNSNKQGNAKPGGNSNKQGNADTSSHPSNSGNAKPGGNSNKQGNANTSSGGGNREGDRDRSKGRDDGAGSRWRQKPCMYFPKGTCRNGANCPFSHILPPT